MHHMNRREAIRFLGASAAAVAFGPAVAGAAETVGKPSDKPHPELQAKARKNLKLGMMTGVYGGLPLEEAARRMREDGFSCVVLQPGFKDIGFDPLKPDWDALKKIRATLEKNKLEIVGLYGYYNVVDPDANRRKVGEQRIEVLINNWPRFGTPVISTETGSFNPTSEWAEDPKNQTEEGYKGCRAVFEKLARAAEKTKAVIAIEGYWKNVIGSVERAERLFKDVASPSLKLTLDPANYFRNEELPNMDATLRDMFKRVGKQTAIAHAKDVKAKGKEQELPAAGRGVLNYPLFLRLLTRLDRPMPLVLEHLSLDDVPRARDYVKAQMDKI
jgi:sugar phosphate isomerase/epimerase